MDVSRICHCFPCFQGGCCAVLDLDLKPGVGGPGSRQSFAAGAQATWAHSHSLAPRPPCPLSDGSAHQWETLSTPHYFYNLSEFAN